MLKQEHKTQYQYIIDRIVEHNEVLQNDRELSVVATERIESARNELIILAEKYYNSNREHLLKMKRLYSCVVDNTI